MADKDPTEDEERQPFPCPIEGCGKLIALNAIEAHMETHGADTEPSPDSMMVDSDSSGSNPHPTSQSTNNGSKAAASASGVKRLGVCFPLFFPWPSSLVTRDNEMRGNKIIVRS